MSLKSVLEKKRTEISRRQFLMSSTLMALFGTFISPYNPKVINVQDDHYLSLIRKHFDRMLKVGLDVYGPEKTGMWLASIDVREGGQYEDITDASRRVYRQIHAPRGSSLYWDQSTLAAAHLVTDLTGKQKYGDSADKYIKDFLVRCISKVNGLFLWGNHHYYDVFKDENVNILSPIHETRPISPAWSLFWRFNEEVTERAIRAMGRFHVSNPATGEFGRHANTLAMERPEEGKAGLSFLEFGGVLIESLCWLAGKQDRDTQLIDNAHNIARFSFNTRSEKTGLMRNQEGTSSKRWDYHECTTEIGLWARCLLRAAEYISGERKESIQNMARKAVAAYLSYGFDEQAGKFYGALNVDSGIPALDFDPTYPFRPGTYADVWEPLFPTHDYPMSMAEACIDLYNLTGEDIFWEGIQRWVEHVKNSLPASYAKVGGGFPSTSVRRAENRDELRIQGAYAGDYGRVIHFLARSAEYLNEPTYRKLAEELASEAVDKLYIEDAGMFRSNPERYTCDAVDEIGILFLSLLKLEENRTGEAWGFYI